jgi:hypothetical protein
MPNSATKSFYLHKSAKQFHDQAFSRDYKICFPVPIDHQMPHSLAKSGDHIFNAAGTSSPHLQIQTAMYKEEVRHQ